MLIPHLPRRGPRHPTLALVWLMLAVGSVVACGDNDGPEQSVDLFLSGWRSGDLNTIGFRTSTGERLPADDVSAQIKQLSGDLASTTLKLSRTGKATINGTSARVNIKVEWALPGDVTWSYSRPVRLRQGRDERWQVIWEPSLVHERLTNGDRLALSRIPATRAPVLDASSAPIVVPRAVVVVGVQPGEVSDVNALVKSLDSAFKAIRPAITPPVDLTGLPKRLREAQSDAFVEVVTLRREAYLQIKPRIYDLPGTKFRQEQRDLAPTREFARAALGSVDLALREDLEAAPDRYAVGDFVGHGGLQERYDQRLRGAPGVSVLLTRKGPEGEVTTVGDPLFRSDPRPGQPLATTLDVAVQNAADAALAPEPRRAALVAVRISDSAVLAVANGPGLAGQNLAFTAQVPPGSTFKMVSALSLLDQKVVGLDTPIACPKTFSVDGRSFKNSDDMVLGTVPFRTDFARSCNTAFAALAPRLGADGLAQAGRSLGLESRWDVGLDAFSGKVSAGGSPVEQAAAAFGQGTTLVSPLAMAAATAAVANGQWRQPIVVRDPAPAQPAAPGPKLRADSVQDLRTMMREVVTKGSGNALVDVPGAPVHGKTGTAEYDDNPAHTHAWFIGWQGEIAFAVFVEQGGSSTATAIPIAERFLRSLHR